VIRSPSRKVVPSSKSVRTSGRTSEIPTGDDRTAAGVDRTTMERIGQFVKDGALAADSRSRVEMRNSACSRASPAILLPPGDNYDHAAIISGTRMNTTEMTTSLSNTWSNIIITFLTLDQLGLTGPHHPGPGDGIDDEPGQIYRRHAAE